jgi:hypothetical protein
MRQWIKLYWYFEQANFVTKANGFLYFITRIPLIGKRLPHDLYGQSGIKKMIFTLLFSIRLVLPFFTKIIWLLFYYAIALIISHGIDDMFTTFIQFPAQSMLVGFYAWLIVVAIASNFFTLFSFSLDQKAIEFTDYFMVSKKQYLRMALFIKTAQSISYYLPALIVYGFLARNAWLPLIGISGSVFACLVGASLIRLNFQRGWGKGGRISWRILFSLITLGSLYLLFQQTTPSVAFGIGLLVLFSVGSGGFLYYLKQFKRENDFFLYSVERSYQENSELAAITSDSNQYLSEGIQMQQKLSLDQNKKLTHLSGSDYLNGLLFQRYHQLLRKKILLRIGIVALLFLSFIVLTFFNVLPYPSEEEWTKILPGLFFAMYFGSLGKSIVQMVFVNCDISMLYYPFYREKKTILRGFNYRFIQSIIYNGVFAGSILVGFVLLNGVNGFQTSWYFMGVLFLLLTSLTALFSFHELFIYYLLQPFTGDMEVVNPIYKFVSGLLYWISYLNTRLEIAGFTYSILISIILLCYVFIGYLVILRMAPRTFRIKE